MTDNSEEVDNSYRIPRASTGRREEDIELRRLFRNRWAKRVGAILFAAFTYWAGTTKDEWARIPSTSWTDQVNGAMHTVEESRLQLAQLNVRVNGLQLAVEANGLADQRARDEMIAEIRILRGDLQRWFREAGVPAAPPTPRPSSRGQD